MSAANLGRYQIEALLGQNNVTETYRARLAESVRVAETQLFTLKVLRQGVLTPALENRFADAARGLQWTAPAGTANIVEICEGAGPLFAVFEFKEGVNLRQLRAQAVPPDGQMDARMVGLLGRKLAERLVTLHGQADGPRLHGCLSPGNVLVRPDGGLLLLDCGLTEAVRGPGPWPSESWPFAAPEQLRGEPATASSDLFSVGALMFFLWSGRPPFPADSPSELAARIAQGPPACDGLHPAISSAIHRLTRSAPEARPRSASDVVRQLSVALLSANAQVALAATTSRASVTSGSGSESESIEGSDEASASASEPGMVAVEQGDGDGEDDGNAPIPFSLERADEARPGRGPARGAVAADDPDVGVVYDDEDEEDEVEVQPDGTVRRRRRRRSIRLLEWTRSEFARKVFRYAWVPVAVVLMVVGVEGFLFARSWRAARAQQQARDTAMAAERARLDAAKPKLAAMPAVPAGHLVLKVSPPGATVWLDGQEAGSAPSTMLTQPGSHRLVITAPGYRMLRDVVDTSHGAVFEREMAPAAFPLTGSVGVNVACATEGKYPVLIDGKEIGAFCPIAGVRLDPGKHLVGVFVIPQNRIWTLEREIVAEHPHRVQFSY